MDQTADVCLILWTLIGPVSEGTDYLNFSGGLIIINMKYLTGFGFDSPNAIKSMGVED